MKRKDNPIYECYEFSHEEILRVKELLSDPLLQAFIKNIVATELTNDFLADLAVAGDSYDSTKLLVNNAFNKGLIAFAKQLIIIKAGASGT